jgi:hypothetical protein
VLEAIAFPFSVPFGVAFGVPFGVKPDGAFDAKFSSRHVNDDELFSFF